MYSNKQACRKSTEKGATLIELMIGMVILAVGLGALTPVFMGSMTSNATNSKDTSAILLAQKVVEELTAQNTNSTATLTLTDCVGNTWTIPSTQGLPFASGGQGAALATNPSSPYYGGIDFTQSLSSVPTGFSMQYVDCDPNGAGQTTYDVRWNVATITLNNTRLITASAQRQGNTQGTGLGYRIPATLRAVGGS